MGLLDTVKLPDGIQALDYDALKKLAAEVRELIIDVVSNNGGHLAPSLGVVELTIALLKVFKPDFDKIVWDVGHQSYAYKILTDRRERFHTLRTYKGISGFIKPSESIFDAFGVGHTSTSISAGLGIKIASDILGKGQKVVAVIGDGAMTAGLAFEGLNNLGQLDKNMIVILNDNEMSISPNVGAFSKHLSKILSGDIYTRFRKDVQKFLENAPLGGQLLHVAKKMEEGLIGFFTPGVIFEELGLRYIGPIDGHNIKDIVSALSNALKQDGPVLVHVATKKGKGYKPAEDNPDIFHGVSSFDKQTGKPLKFASQKTFTSAFGDKLADIAIKNKKVVAITAAMADGTGLKKFAEIFPERFFDVGIAEQHAVTFAAGLAISGLKPYVAIYSTFLQRAYDQIIHDVALQNLPVVLCIDRAGLVGADGPTHHGSFDLSYLRCIPNLTIMMPKNIYELERMLEMAQDINSPVAIRYPRGGEENLEGYIDSSIELYRPEIVSGEGDIAIVTGGHIFSQGFNAHKKLEKIGIKTSLINMRFLKPVETDSLIKVLNNKKLIVTIEENSIKGGMGEEIASILLENNIYTKVIKLGIPDKFIEHGDVNILRKLLKIDSDSIVELISRECQK
ncbi:MAG: 1-deoxy-D-xylulose-5-phosphate synthase [Deferribacteres bacterium]|jgi:1-deoxy-D-xylulose-5-phosphate synthase|nr:1-deoxy-D-xylulose-5-phosphate synthase [Deferribacteraceae bacterium]MDK2792906.1 1-deoxy-D-xylulose-5-phosphate synthase [Deferribacteres bacterium]